MTAKQYRQQLNAKWGNITDPYTRNLVAQLLDYAQGLENRNSNIAPPDSVKYSVSPRGEELNLQSFRDSIDFTHLQQDNAAQGENESVGVSVLVAQLLDYTQHLEQNHS